MESSEERVRFCDRCNAVVGWYAGFCDACGERLGGAAAGSPATSAPAAAIAPSSVEKDLFRAQLRLVHKCREEAARLDRSLEKLSAALEENSARRTDPAARRAYLGLAERFFELEQEWEQLQHAYNARSESLEEEFLERIEELEADLELSPDHQAALNEEVAMLVSGLEAAEERIRETGRLLDVVEARHRSRVLGFSTGPRGTLALGISAFLLAGAGAAWGVLVAGLPPKSLATALIPSWVGICALFLNARSKSL